MKYVVMLSTYGFMTVTADTQEKAIEEAVKAKREDIDWAENWEISDCRTIKEG